MLSLGIDNFHTILNHHLIDSIKYGNTRLEKQQACNTTELYFKLHKELEGQANFFKWEVY